MEENKQKPTNRKVRRAGDLALSESSQHSLVQGTVQIHAIIMSMTPKALLGNKQGDFL